MTAAARHYLIVTASYWGFTLVDGALRMLVLLYFFKLGYAPFTLAFLFLLYEFAGIVANLAGGWLATRFGIARMLTTGQVLQIVGLLMLAALDPGWSGVAAVSWVMLAQGVAGIAKDFTKTASKSAIKATSSENTGQLFRWVAWFTGSKNAMKGLGFFLGGLLLELAGFRAALIMMAGLLGLVLIAGLIGLPRGFGKAAASKSMRELFSKARGVNLLALARVFLFGARDVWFVIGLPLFLYAQGWSFAGVGGFLAAWTIGYGGVQALAPALVARSSDGLSREVPGAQIWGGLLALVPAVLLVVLQAGALAPQDRVVVAGLAIFGLAFAVTSSLHSYLILAYAGSKKAAEDVGFYYAANATGRLIGILLSGGLYHIGGISACLAGSCALLGIAFVVSLALPKVASHPRSAEQAA